MMKKNKLIAAIHLFVSIAFFHCAPNVDLEQERQTLLKTDFEFAKASQEKGAVAAFYAYLDSNATLIPINADPVFGRQAIYTHMSTAPEVQLFWEPKLAEVAQSGDMGYTWGMVRYEAKGPDGQPVTGYGKYVNVWKKQSDGSWKVVVDIGNQSPAPENRQAF